MFERAEIINRALYCFPFGVALLTIKIEPCVESTVVFEAFFMNGMNH